MASHHSTPAQTTSSRSLHRHRYSRRSARARLDGTPRREEFKTRRGSRRRCRASPGCVAVARPLRRAQRSRHAGTERRRRAPTSASARRESSSSASASSSALGCVVSGGRPFGEAERLRRATGGSPQQGQRRLRLQRLPAHLDDALQVEVGVLDVAEQDERLARRRASVVRAGGRGRSLEPARVGSREVRAGGRDRRRCRSSTHPAASVGARALRTRLRALLAPRSPASVAASSTLTATSALGCARESARCRARSTGSSTIAAKRP